MSAFTEHNGVVVPLDRANVDTDAIMPKQFLKSIAKTGYGPYVFDEWRYLDKGAPGMDCQARPVNPDFVLNNPAYQKASILLARENFGCGSSREHAPWGLVDYGFRVIIAPSFAEIFYSNSLKNGLLLITLPSSEIEALFHYYTAHPGEEMKVVLSSLQIVTPNQSFAFDIAPSDKQRLSEGWDDIDITLQYKDDIVAYEQQRKEKAPWLLIGE